ncbi:uncharacterized protein J8A68_002399 [[Candida] subhashii]|uniref:RNase III domain-containing protein n=1 Tax=[Candida] subhashii TaxID=561895 RepID=A0A8J5QXK7_9ASCO|nr:uncharacterized protein J8A68_002399 [[Candida] subhashii]KAG7664075.1 hypothetical protein J8A68_002399 [[Candida] subhashii]
MTTALSKPLLNICDDLHQVKGSVSQLQATFNSIVSKSPTIDEYRQWLTLLNSPNSILFQRESKSNIERFQQSVLSPQTKVGVRLRQLYDSGNLPLIQSLCKINFKSNNADKFLDHFLAYNPPIDPDNLIDNNNKGNILGSYYSYPPALPTINNQPLLLRITTDKSYRQPSDFLESAETHDFNKSHNSKLAIKGKSIMELVLIEVLDEMFPNLYDDDLIVIRHKLMASHILTKFSFGYNLVDHAKYNLSVNIDLDSKLDVIGNIFLSYIAGLSIEGYSMKDIKLWIKKLYEPIIQDTLYQYNPTASISLAELNLLFRSATNFYQIPKEEINYEIVQIGSDPYVAQVLVNGEPLGIGSSAISFEEAKNRAANDILNDKERIIKIIQMLYQNYETNSNGKQGLLENSMQLPIPPPPPGLPGSTQSTNSPTPPVKPNVASSPERPTQSANPNPPQGFPTSTYPDISPAIPPPPPPPTVPPPQQQQQASPTINQSRKLSFPTYQPPGPMYNVPPIDNSQHAPGPLPYGLAPLATFSQKPHPQPPQPPSEEYTPPTIGSGIKAGVDANSKNELYAKLGPYHLTPLYEYRHLGNEFQANVKVNGIVLGIGYDSNKKIAGQKAAMCALTNHEILKSLGINN